MMTDFLLFEEKVLVFLVGLSSYYTCKFFCLTTAQFASWMLTEERLLHLGLLFRGNNNCLINCASLTSNYLPNRPPQEQRWGDRRLSWLRFSSHCCPPVALYD